VDLSVRELAIDAGPSNREGLTIGYVGNLLGRYVIGQWGSGFVLSLANLPRVASVELFCSQLDPGLSRDPIDYPPTVFLRRSYDRDRPLSILNTLWALRRWQGDLLVFNMNTTSFGSRSSSNLLGLLMPVVVRTIFRKPAVVVYHSSVLTTDFERLGYTSFFDRVRGAVASTVERLLFRMVPTFVLLECYKDRLDRKVPNAHVRTFRNEYLEAIPTITMNKLDTPGLIVHCGRAQGQVPTLLLHGYWGPQKDLDGILRTLQSLASEGVRFNLTLSGSVNPHFPAYAAHLEELMTKYRGIITSRLGAVPETDVAGLMTQSDLLLLPYNASGGQSGVMEIASCFDLPSIVSDFPEYREKAMTKPTVVLCESSRMDDAIRSALAQMGSRAPRQIALSDKVAVAGTYVDKFLREAQAAG
jgi:glycosyltransferase involved in cell wall biosynthesis